MVRIERTLNSAVDVTIDEEIRIHADGRCLTVTASDVIEYVREFNNRGTLPLGGTVLPDGSVKLRNGVLDEEDSG